MSQASQRKKAVTPPEWFARTSIYQINPRTFCKEGTIKAVTAELPFLAELGFDTMYICPIFEEDVSENRDNWSERQKKYGTENPKNPYRMNDYFAIDEEYGTMEDLREFVRESHKLGMKVLFDLVYLHIGPNARIFEEHPEFAMHDEQGNVILSEWMFPRLNYECEGLREYLWCNMTYFIGVIGIDGFRCDVGDAVPLDFWIEGRRRIQAIKPDAVMLNEGSNWEYLEQGFDSSYCMSWHGRLRRALDGRDPVTMLRQRHQEIAADAPEGAVLMRDFDNHDTVTDWPSRNEVLAGHDGMELVQALNYTIDGIPMVYCGNELADTANLNMFANRFYMGKYEVTDRSLKDTDAALRRGEVIKKLNALKREKDALVYGSTVWLDNDAPENVLSFARVHGDKKIVFIGNITRDACECTVDGIDVQNGNILLQSQTAAQSKDGRLSMPAFSYLIVEY